MKLSNIQIERFKRLESVNFDVEDANILIGGNNSGKSTIIQAIHFAFTLLQSLNISNKWPAQGTRSLTISPSELIYIPSEDPYSLGFGGRLLEDEARRIVIAFVFDDGRTLRLGIRKGRITNLIVEPNDVAFGKTLADLESPYSIYSPGLAGVSRTENYVSDGVLLRALARGDANIILRNILERLRHRKAEWAAFREDLVRVFPRVSLHVNFEPKVDQYIDVKVIDGGQTVPLDLSGTGLLQAVQILAYLHLFAPKLIVLDEPDSHLHPNNQRGLCSLLMAIAREREVQIIMTTHSRHVLDAMDKQTATLWVQGGKVTKATPDDQVDILLELGALDINEKLRSQKHRIVVLTEDSATSYLTILLKNSGFPLAETLVLPYNGVTSPHFLKPVIDHIRSSSKAPIVIHRDRDFMEAMDVDDWQQKIRAMGAEPFVTGEMDIEGYFCNETYLAGSNQKVQFSVQDMKKKVTEGLESEIIASYVNGRLDLFRKDASMGKVDVGKLSADVSDKVRRDPWNYMKGKKKLGRVRLICQEELKFKYEIDPSSPLPSDPELKKLSDKHFPRKREAA